MRAARSEEMQMFLISMDAPEAQRGSDVYLWRNASGIYTKTFSSKSTWEQVRDHSPTVSWYKAVWFKESVPRSAFITWLVVQKRLPTRDRLRNWGLNVPASCVLCSSGTETHDHLFFGCAYTMDIWRDLASRIWQNPPLDISAVVTWILQSHDRRLMLQLQSSSSSCSSRQYNGFGRSATQGYSRIPLLHPLQ